MGRMLTLSRRKFKGEREREREGTNRQKQRETARESVREDRE